MQPEESTVFLTKIVFYFLACDPQHVYEQGGKCSFAAWCPRDERLRKKTSLSVFRGVNSARRQFRLLFTARDC